MTQSVVIQVGQCGNQIGYRFWDLALREHASINAGGIYDSALSTFFSNSNGLNNEVSGLKARAVLVDMEEGVVSELMKGPLRNLFDYKQLITDVSGSGNNWAVGNCFYGKRFAKLLTEKLRKAAELCDCLQCFFLIHSMGGGTGSGVGTFVLELLADEYPDIHRIVTAVFPSADDDVITSPYNSVLALNRLTQLADCVFPIDNQALARITQRVVGLSGSQTSNSSKSSDFGNYLPVRIPKNKGLLVAKGSVVDSGGSIDSKKSKPFDGMNNIVANMLLNLTSSARFEGTMNIDLSEISMNLVPFPRLHYILASQSPLVSNKATLAPRKVDQVFSDVFTPDYQLVTVDPSRHAFLAAALLLRGQVGVSDVRRNIQRLQSRLRFIPWNQSGWKVGHCLAPPVGQTFSLLALSNNAVVHETFGSLLGRFNQLYRRKAHLHHYTGVEGFEPDWFRQSITSLTDLIAEYHEFEEQTRLGTLASLPTIQIAD